MNIELIKSFLNASKVLIVDKRTPSRRNLRAHLFLIGVSDDNIFESDNVKESCELIKDHLPSIVIFNTKLSDGSGFNIVSYYKNKYVESENCIFLVVTGTTAHPIVSQASEEQVDAFILRPFKFAYLSSIIHESIERKLVPSEYSRLIGVGIKYLELNKIEKAKSVFEDAIKKYEAPSIAHYYLGQCYVEEERLDDAELQYKKGIKFNPVHRHCLVGLMHLYESKKDFKNAYEVSRVIARFFPANAERLANAIRLAITIEEYDDILMFYKVYRSLRAKGLKVLDFMCSGLCVAGKHYLIIEDNENAIQCFKYVTEIYNGKVKYLRSIFENMAEFEKFEECALFLKSFPSYLKDTDEYSLCSYFGNLETMEPKSKIEEGLELLKKGIESFSLNLVLAKSYRELGNQKEFDRIIIYMKKKWPMKMDRFKSLF